MTITTMLVLSADFTCTSRVVSGGAGAAVSITAAVGNQPPPRCPNRAGDVRTIQQALNRFTPLDGGPAPPLAVDGIFGPKTRDAIYHFQKKWNIKPKAWKVPDGIVDPDGPTIARLRQGAGPQVNLPVEFMARIPRVLAVLLAARRVLDAAARFIDRAGVHAIGASLPAFDSFGQSEARKVDKHFHIKAVANPRGRVLEVDSMFLNMMTAIGYVPQGIILAVDEPAGMAQGAFMFTFPGGYHFRRPTDTVEGIHVGSIYLCPRSRTLSDDAFTYVMIHELAHFSGPVKAIDDHAYFYKSPDAYRRLTPQLAFGNADSYAQFAYEAIGKPDFLTHGS